MSSSSNYKIIYYKDNGMVSPEFHIEWILKINSNGILKIKKLKGYEDQILFSCIYRLRKEEQIFLKNCIDNLQKLLSNISKEHFNFLNNRMGSPIEYIQIFLKNNTWKWYYKEKINSSDTIDNEFNLLYHKIRNIVKNLPINLE